MNELEIIISQLIVGVFTVWFYYFLQYKFEEKAKKTKT